MYNVIIAFGNYLTRLRNGKVGPYTQEELGLMWLKHVAAFSAPGMLKKYRLVLLLPRELLIPETYNPDLDQWGEKKRIDDNNGPQPWPAGANSVFKQVLWCYAYDKLQGPFLWCEPDCIPTKADWLDQLFAEYERVGKPFMGHLIDGFLGNGVRVPKHMTGNAIYPDKAYKLAPKLLQCHGTAWDVYAADEILKIENFHDTLLIHHELSDQEHLSYDNISVLCHPDKTGILIRALGGEVPFVQSDLAKPEPPGKTLSEVFGEEGDKPVDDMLHSLLRVCRDDRDIHRKVAYFMIDNEIVSRGYWATAMRIRNKAKKEEAAHAEPAA